MADIYRDRPPLWKAMDAARPPSLTVPDRFWMYERGCFAAELRAIADWLTPESSEETAPWAIRFTTLRAVLLAEADKAEGKS